MHALYPRCAQTLLNSAHSDPEQWVRKTGVRMEALKPLCAPPTYKPDRPRIDRCRLLARDQYPDVVAQILMAEMDVWGEFGYRLGGHLVMMKLMTLLEKRATQPPLDRCGVE